MTFTLTRAHRAAIVEAVRRVSGRGASIEVGTRLAAETSIRRTTPNGLLWAPGADLFDLLRFSEVRTIGADPTHPGAALLDLFVYVGRGVHRELDRNLLVVIDGGAVVLTTQHEAAASEETRRRFGRPFFA